MLTSEFSAELSAHIRSLQDRIRIEPALKDGHVGPYLTDLDMVAEDLDRAIIRLVALRLSL